MMRQLPIASSMHPEQLAVIAGWADTRAAFARWNNDVAGIVRAWMGTSLLIGIALLLSTWAIGTHVAPQDVGSLATFSGEARVGHAVHVFGRNLLVLAMHALICVAGYMAATSVVIAADAYTGWKRRAHLVARPATFLFIGWITISSVPMQAWTLGSAAPRVAAAYGLEVWQLLAVVSVHAIPELVAVFLPLGAWLVIARRRAWNELLAASILATAIALPLLVMSAVVEEFVTPLLLEAVVG